MPRIHQTTGKLHKTTARLMVSVLGLSLLTVSGCMAALVPAVTLGVSGGTYAGGKALGSSDGFSRFMRCNNVAGGNTSEMSLDCEDGQELAARRIALGEPEPRYDQIANAVGQCDAGKIPSPPLVEEHCDDYRAIKKAIDDRVAELKASGAV